MTKQINRKDFIRKSAAGLAGMAFLSKKKLFSKSPSFDIEYRTLGRTGIKVSPIGMGATRTLEESIVKAAIDQGVNFLDTGRSYANGKNEEMIGNAIKGIRDRVVIQSKLKFRKNYPAGLEESLNESLKALQTDYIDIMLLHGATETEEINNEVLMEFFTKAKKSGKIRACGFSTHRNMAGLTEWNNSSGFYDVIMGAFNHAGKFVHSRSGWSASWDQESLISQLTEAHRKKIGFVAMKTASGGPYSPDENTEETYAEALRWILMHDFVATVAVAMANFSEINENVQAMF
ncbi:MAG: aldo/keto reductase [Bacteroidales bacterium]|nr:aldo/keto reductase [Bacteroidales bacterium]